MYAVILQATAGELDQEYKETIERMKQLAFDKYGCLDFVSIMDGDRRMAISYWDTEAQILQWKADAEHGLAQERAKQKWYQSYRVQVVEVKRDYSFNM